VLISLLEANHTKTLEVPNTAANVSRSLEYADTCFPSSMPPDNSQPQQLPSVWPLLLTYPTDGSFSQPQNHSVHQIYELPVKPMYENDTPPYTATGYYDPLSTASRNACPSTSTSSSGASTGNPHIDLQISPTCYRSPVLGLQVENEHLRSRETM
jgi:hypothetical protein